jgi:hypothetical protein
MIRKILCCLFLLYPLLGWAQNEMQTINAIKSDITFLYAMGTSTVSADEATGVARELINLEIEQWLKERSVTDVAGYMAKSKDSLSQINTHRGNLYRAFVFVKKQDIIPYSSDENVLVGDFLHTQSDSEVVNTMPTPQMFTPNARERSLLSITTFTALNDYINQGRQSGLIEHVGNYKTLPATEACYVFIHNREGDIPAHIKWQGAKAVNMATGQSDSIQNYKGCGAICIQFNDK